MMIPSWFSLKFLAMTPDLFIFSSRKTFLMPHLVKKKSSHIEVQFCLPQSLLVKWSSMMGRPTQLRNTVQEKWLDCAIDQWCTPWTKSASFYCIMFSISNLVKDGIKKVALRAFICSNDECGCWISKDKVSVQRPQSLWFHWKKGFKVNIGNIGFKNSLKATLKKRSPKK